jgi:hypothetical protein
MTRGKLRLLLGISIVCQLAAFIIRHSHLDAADFFKGMGTATMVGAMIVMVRKTRLQR